MGIRADFYIGRGERAEWIGSIAWNGYPDDVELIEALHAVTEEDYRRAVGAMFGRRRDATLPEQGWPWPWEDSGTTDYAYALEDSKVWTSAFGSEWFDPLAPQPDDLADDVAVFPDMTARQRVTLGARSGVIVIGPTGIEGDD